MGLVLGILFLWFFFSLVLGLGIGQVIGVMGDDGEEKKEFSSS